MKGIKICFYCAFVYNGVNSPLICDFVKVASVVNIKLLFYGLILLWFDNTN